MARGFAGRRTFRPAPASQRPILYPAGTQLAEVPPLARGLTEMQYLDFCITQWKGAPVPPPPAEPAQSPVFGRRMRR